MKSMIKSPHRITQFQYLITNIYMHLLWRNTNYFFMNYENFYEYIIFKRSKIQFLKTILLASILSHFLSFIKIIYPLHFYCSGKNSLCFTHKKNNNNFCWFFVIDLKDFIHDIFIGKRKQIEVMFLLCHFIFKILEKMFCF